MLRVVHDNSGDDRVLKREASGPRAWRPQEELCRTTRGTHKEILMHDQVGNKSTRAKGTSCMSSGSTPFPIVLFHRKQKKRMQIR